MAGHRLRTLGIAAVVTIGLLVAADRIALAVGERVAADSLQSSQHLPQRPGVSVAGFPFLTQLATGHFGDVTIDVDDVPVPHSPLRLARLHVRLREVHASRDFGTIHAAAATATATLGYADLSRVLGAHVHYAGDGRVAAHASVGALGVSVGGTASARIEASSGGLRFADSRVQVAGQSSAAVNQALDAIFDHTIPLRGLPFRISLTAVHTTPDGIALTFVGHHLVYRS